MSSNEKHQCHWGSIVWEDFDGPISAGDDWVVRQHGKCACGREVYEEFISDNSLRDNLSSLVIDGAGKQW